MPRRGCVENGGMPLIVEDVNEQKDVKAKKKNRSRVVGDSTVNHVLQTWVLGELHWRGLLAKV